MGQISIRLTDKIEAELKEKATAKGQTLAEYCRSELKRDTELKPVERLDISARLNQLDLALNQITTSIRLLAEAHSDDRRIIEGNITRLIEAFENLEEQDAKEHNAILSKIESSEQNILDNITYYNCFIEAFFEKIWKDSSPKAIAELKQKAYEKYDALNNERR